MLTVRRYRWKTRYGYGFIRADSDKDALSQIRGMTPDVQLFDVEFWDGKKYTPLQNKPCIS